MISPTKAVKTASNITRGFMSVTNSETRLRSVGTQALKPSDVRPASAGGRRRDKRAVTIARLALASARELSQAVRASLAQEKREHERQHDGADPNHIGMREGRRRHLLTAVEGDEHQTEVVR